MQVSKVPLAELYTMKATVNRCIRRCFSMGGGGGGVDLVVAQPYMYLGGLGACFPRGHFCYLYALKSILVHSGTNIIQNGPSNWVCSFS